MFKPEVAEGKSYVGGADANAETQAQLKRVMKIIRMMTEMARISHEHMGDMEAAWIKLNAGGVKDVEILSATLYMLVPYLRQTAELGRDGRIAAENDPTGELQGRLEALDAGRDQITAMAGEVLEDLLAAFVTIAGLAEASKVQDGAVITVTERGEAN